MAIRICRHCGVVLENVKAADFKRKVKCDACGEESVFLTEKQAKEAGEKLKAQKERERQLILLAKEIHEYLPNMPIMAYSDSPGFSNFIYAISLGIRIPENTTRTGLKELIRKAKDAGSEGNPFVFHGWTNKQQMDYWASKSPAYPNLVEMLLKFNICSNHPLTAYDGERIRSALVDSVYECPHCSAKNNRSSECNRCGKNIEHCLYEAVLEEGTVRLVGILSDGILKIANGPSYKYIPHKYSWSGHAALELDMPGGLRDSQIDLSKVPIIEFGKSKPTLHPDEIKAIKKRKRFVVLAAAIAALCIVGALLL